MKLINVMYYEVSPTAVWAYSNPVKISEYGLSGPNMHSISPDLVETKEPGIYNADGVKINPENYKEPSEWLPRNLREEWVYAAMGRDGEWDVYYDEPTFDSILERWHTITPDTGNFRISDGLFQTYFDSQGPAKSLHKKVNGRWER